MPFSRLFALVAAALLTACTATDGLDAPPVPLGDFRLGHNIVVGDTAKQIPPTRAATAEEWETILGGELQKRFGRYEGEGLYHLGVSVDGYALAIPGVPIVLKPRSVLVISVTLWDNATQSKLNPDVVQLTVFEGGGLNERGIIGSGLTQTKEEQMQTLSYNAARAIQRWLVVHEEWFDGDPATNPPEAPPPPPRE